MKKLFKGVILVSICLLAACGKTEGNEEGRLTGAPEQKDGKITQVPESTKQPETTVVPESTKQPEITGEPVKHEPILLHVQTEDNRIEEWDENGPLYYVTWQTLSLGEEDRTAYPALADALEELGRNKEAEAEQTAKELASVAEELKQYVELQEYGLSCYDTTKYFIRRADHRIFSTRVDWTSDTESIHPSHFVFSLNLNPQTGEPVALEEVIPEPVRLLELLEKRLPEKYGDELFPDWKDTFSEYTADTLIWTMDYEGITVYFNTYEVSPYVAGLLTVTVKFEEMPELFAEEYRETPETGYAMELPFAETLELGKDRADGKKDELTVYQSLAEEGDGQLRFEVMLNGQSVPEAELFSYEFTPYLVCLEKDGTEQYYLYVESVHENEFHVLTIFDLNGERLAGPIAELNGGFHTEAVTDGMEGWSTYRDVFLNPADYRLDSRLDFMGTTTGTREYSTDTESGVPVSKTEYYEWNTDRMPLTAKLPVEVTMISENEKETLAVGTKLYFLRTDNETYAEFCLEDGRECRVEADTTKWPRTINGIPEEECFDGISYAG